MNIRGGHSDPRQPSEHEEQFFLNIKWAIEEVANT